MSNIYFIIPFPPSAEIKSVVVDKTFRKNNSGDKCICKLPESVEIIPDILIQYTAFSHSKIIEELKKSEWQSDIL